MRYRIVPERSRVWIEGRSSLHPIHSSADGLEGYLDVDAPAVGAVTIAVPPAGELSFPVKRLSSTNPLETREMHRRIDARRFPTIDGVLTEVERVDGTDVYRVGGELTFRGVTQHCEGELSLQAVDEHTVRFAGEAQFDVRDFGMEPPRILMLRVEPEVVVQIEVIAEREGP